jgi:PiT family inorganic phosphate transporter
MLLIFTVIFVALVFTYTNGFHDTANSIATVVGTKVLTPRQAIVLAAVTNLIGAFFGAAVAKTISGGLVDSQYISSGVLVCALSGSIVWNLLTWYFGLPSSSSHALVGGLCGAAVASAHNKMAAIYWVQIKTKTVHVIDPSTHETVAKTVTEKAGLLYKVMIPMVSSPVAGFVVGFIVMGLLYLMLRNWRPATVNAAFGKLQLLSSGYMGFSHGMNDATKCMGIITLALVAGTKGHMFDHFPAWLSFLSVPEAADPKNQIIPKWVTALCSLTMGAGTAAGGWRIIKTLSHKMVKLQPVQGFAAETTGATVLAITASWGMPVSTTHAITTSIMGVGCAKRFSALKLAVVERILWAWILTLPATAGVGYLLVRLSQIAGWLP